MIIYFFKDSAGLNVNALLAGNKAEKTAVIIIKSSIVPNCFNVKLGYIIESYPKLEYVSEKRPKSIPVC
jgi:hypothetical protein